MRFGSVYCAAIDSQDASSLYADMLGFGFTLSAPRGVFRRLLVDAQTLSTRLRG